MATNDLKNETDEYFPCVSLFAVCTTAEVNEDVYRFHIRIMLLEISVKRERQHCLATARMSRQPQKGIAAFSKKRYKRLVAANPLACTWEWLWWPGLVIVLIQTTVLVEQFYACSFDFTQGSKKVRISLSIY